MTLLTPILIILVVAVLVGVVWLFSPAAALQAAISVGVIACMGISTGILGELLPRRWFNWDKFPFKTYAWEDGGKLYERLKIRRWKDKMPDKSRWGGHIYAKTIRGQNDPENVTRLLQETCVAELIHWLLLVISPAVLLFAHGPMAVLVAALYGLSNFPFIMIQRYNRPRLRALLKRCKRKEPELV